MSQPREKGFSILELMAVIVVLVMFIIALAIPKDMTVAVPSSMISALPTTGNTSAWGYAYNAAGDDDVSKFTVSSGSKVVLTLACDKVKASCTISK